MTKKVSNHTKPLRIPKFIIFTTKVIAFLSANWATYFAARLFITPIKHKVPKREIPMDIRSEQNLILIPTINRKVNVYEFGKSNKKVLLVHGWSGRGTQMCKIADELKKNGYSTISFDAPAHGKSPGSTTIMVDFIASILEIDKCYGPFEIAIGHSLGGMSVLNAIKEGLQVKKAVVIGSGDVVQDITNDFIAKLGLKQEYSIRLCNYFEYKYGGKMDDYSAYKAAKSTDIPTLVIHDENDPEVAVSAGKNIYNHLKNGEILITKGLGHRKILADNQVIEKLINFIKK